MDVITAQNISKQYKRTQKVSRFIDLFEYRSIKERFYALKDVSFRIKNGERVGIIGPNGAGKSTLIKILSRITPPTSGQVRIKGRVTSLLEVGTGFHPDLSGRDNIYMKGILLGMSKAEVDKQYEKIISFSEIEGFIEDPIRKYSSGMRLRLAFSIGVHLKSNILLLDEVITVGDPGFQEKCIKKIKEISNKGKTVMLVSHDLDRIMNFADRILFIDKGRIQFDSTITQLLPFLEKYSSSYQQTDKTLRQGAGNIIFDDLKFPKLLKVRSDQEVEISLNIVCHKPLINGNINLRLTNSLGKTLLSWRYREHNNKSLELTPGRYKVSLCIDELSLVQGLYYISMSILNNEIEEDFIENALTIKTVMPDKSMHRNASKYIDSFFFRPAYWSIKKE